MKIINPESLYKTLDNLNQHLFYDVKLTSKEKTEVARWLSDRQGVKGSYANMFAPAGNDFEGIKLFTGYKLTSKASIAHILGEETLRALYLLKSNDTKVNKAISESRTGINKVLKYNYDSGNYIYGTFCCGKCTAALWRNLSAEGVGKNKKALETGIKYLKSLRDGKGKWKRFPFFYTLLALTDINLPASKEELTYASEVCKKYLNRKSTGDVYGKRKRDIAKKVLELI